VAWLVTFVFSTVEHLVARLLAAKFCALGELTGNELAFFLAVALH
jgi:hypothetical protein